MHISNIIVKYNNNSFLKRILKNKTLCFMALPGVLYLFIVNYIPIFGVVMAFQDFKPHLGFFKSKFVGLRNFEFFFKTDASRVIVNTLYLNILFIVTTLVCAVTLAIILNEIKNKLYSKVVQTMMFLPHFLSYVIVGFFVLAFLNPEFGYFNRLLLNSGLDTVMWYNEAKYWPFILVAINLWKGIGISTVIYLAAIINIPDEYYEAAQIDGAGRLKQVFYITLPSISHIISILTLLSIGNLMRGNFDLVYNVTQNSGSLYSTTDVIDTYVIRALRQVGDIGMSTSVGLFQSVVGFILVNVSNYAVKKRNPEHALF